MRLQSLAWLLLAGLAYGQAATPPAAAPPDIATTTGRVRAPHAACHALQCAANVGRTGSVPGTGTGDFAGWSGPARIVHDDQGAFFEIDLA